MTSIRTDGFIVIKNDNGFTVKKDTTEPIRHNKKIITQRGNGYSSYNPMGLKYNENGWSNGTVYIYYKPKEVGDYAYEIHNNQITLVVCGITKVHYIKL